MTTVLFELGTFFVTKAALDALNELEIDARDLIARHAKGDFGDVTSRDLETNIEALDRGYRILSKYLIGENLFFVVTEANRSSTTVLLAEEY